MLRSLTNHLRSHAVPLQLGMSDWLIERLALKNHHEYRSNIIEVVAPDLSPKVSFDRLKEAFRTIPDSTSFFCDDSLAKVQYHGYTLLAKRKQGDGFNGLRYHP